MASAHTVKAASSEVKGSTSRLSNILQVHYSIDTMLSDMPTTPTTPWQIPRLLTTLPVPKFLWCNTTDISRHSVPIRARSSSPSCVAR
jgi:hypothetical protein